MRKGEIGYKYSSPIFAAILCSLWGLRKKIQYIVTAIAYKIIAPPNTGLNPYTTWSHPLIDGLKALPKLQTMLYMLAAVARDVSSTCSMIKVW